MKKDYLAICLIGVGSSHGRAPTKEKAVEYCKRFLERDWSSLFDLHGTEAKISVFDVTGYDNLHWDYRGVHPDNDPKKILPLLEVVTVTLNVPKKLRPKRREHAKTFRVIHD